MPIVDIQRRFRELGRLRMGRVEKPPGGKARPVKLLTWRLTTPWRHLLDAAIELGIGGEVVDWHNPGTDRAEFELITETDVLDVIIPPGDVLSQFYELWSGGGAIRRCDGATMILDGGKQAAKACRCPADPTERQAAASANPPAACKPVTRLVVMLPGLPDLGVWRLESHGFYAATELAGAAGLCELATRRGTLIPADLRIEPRRIKRAGEQVRRFAVPVLSFKGNLGATLEALGMVDGDRPVSLERSRPALNAGTPELPAAPGDFARAQAIEPEAPDFAEAGEPDAFVPPDPAPDERVEASTMPPDRMLAMRAREAGIADADRKRLYQAITDGRTDTGKELTVAEVKAAFVVIDGVRDGHVGVGVVRDRKGFAVYDRRAKRTLYRLAGDFPLEDPEPSDEVEKPEEAHVEEPDPFVEAGVATEPEPVFDPPPAPAADPSPRARRDVIETRVIEDDDAGTPTGPPPDRPSTSGEWRELLRARGLRVLDALKVTGTASLDGLTVDLSEALLDWINREDHAR